MKPLIAIVGPTGSGKTAAAIELAERIGGEIICADSRTVYKGMDIGTAKPTIEERARVPHHLLDVVYPDERFTVADFKRLAMVAIDEITARGKIPILVGGSGLYIDSVLYDYSFAGPDAPRDEINTRHARADVPRRSKALRENTVIIGIQVPREVLRQRLETRVDSMVADNFIEEIGRLRKSYPTANALLAPGYKAFAQYMDGSISLVEAKALFVTNDYQLARRQMTWFKRNNSIHWVDDPSKIVEIATTLLNKMH